VTRRSNFLAIMAERKECDSCLSCKDLVDNKLSAVCWWFNSWMTRHPENAHRFSPRHGHGGFSYETPLTEIT
jgi:hypothetical protein